MSEQRGLRQDYEGQTVEHVLVHDGTVTRTSVRKLTPDERREEIARMLSGAAITDEARAQATKLLEAA